MAAPVFVSVCGSLYTLFLQHEMKEKLESTQLQQIVIPKEQVQWNILGDEITIDGQLFDVKNHIEQGKNIVFYGLFDWEETALQQKIESQHNQRSNQQAMATIAHFLQSFQCLLNTNTPHPCFIESSFSHTLTSAHSKIRSPFLQSISKPPEAFLFS